MRLNQNCFEWKKTRFSEFDSIFDNMFRVENTIIPQLFSDGMSVAVKDYTIHHSEDEYNIVINAAGFGSDNISVEYDTETKTLEVNGSVDTHALYKDGKKFNYKFKIPTKCNPDNIKVECTNGIIQISLPIDKETKSKRIKLF